MSAPTTAVVIPTHGDSEYWREAVESVLAQSVLPDQIVVVMDGTSEASIGGLREEFPAVTVICQPRLGAAIARNTGVSAASAEWVLFLDHDDLWDREKMARVLEYLAQNPDCQAVHHHDWFFSSTGLPEAGYWFDPDFAADSLAGCQEVVDRMVARDEGARFHSDPAPYERLLLHNGVSLCSAAVRREVLLRAGCFPPSMTEDWRMAVNVARLVRWEELPERLTFHRLHRQSTTVKDMTALRVLVAYVDLWYGGCPYPGAPPTPSELDTLLVRYSSSYRSIVQAMVWRSLRSRDVVGARRVMALGVLLLPRLRDRVFLRIPRRVTSLFQGLRSPTEQPGGWRALSE